MTEIIFVTHSTSLDNERRLASGHADTPLSPLGRRQTAELGERATATPASLPSSAPICSGRTAPRRLRSRTAISPSSETSGCANATMASSRDALPSLWNASGPTESPCRFRAGRATSQATARIRNLLEDMMGRYSDQRIMLVGHRATQYALEHWLNGGPLEGGRHRPVPSGSPAGPTALSACLCHRRRAMPWVHSVAARSIVGV